MQIYVHVPFCKSKCRYCDFNSYACHDKQAIFDYLTALNREIELAGKAFSGAKIDTIYIGGGTPSLLDVSQIENLCENLEKNFDLSGVKEFSIECNPESLDEEKLKAYRKEGINRISIGVQSLFDDNLRAIGRLHDSKTAIEKIKLANRYFDNVSADLIVGLPFDSTDRIKEEVETLAPLVKHLSMYELSIEEGTSLEKLIKQGKIFVPSADETQDLFDVAYDTAQKCGFDRYEVSNFAKDGKISYHNFGYWTREEYLGFGAGAHSFLKISDGENPLENQVRFANFKNLDKYKTAVESTKFYAKICREYEENLDEKSAYEEEIMLALRTKKGVKAERMPSVPAELKRFFDRKDGYVSLKREGMAVMNSILVEILDI